MPNSNEMKGNWEQLKGKIEQKFAEVTEDEMWGKLQEKLGKTEKEIKSLFD
jgi:uncharacterized protein YjbJ (UPF0337 family)